MCVVCVSRFPTCLFDGRTVRNTTGRRCKRVRHRCTHIQASEHRVVEQNTIFDNMHGNEINNIT